MKEPLSACLRRRKSSLAPKSHRRGSITKDGDGGDGGGAGSSSRTGSPGNITPRSANMSRRGSMEPNSEALEALRQLQLKNSKSYRTVSKPATENLGVALKMIKKRRSLFEHGENDCLSLCLSLGILYVFSVQLRYTDMGPGRGGRRCRIYKIN